MKNNDLTTEDSFHTDDFDETRPVITDHLAKAIRYQLQKIFFEGQLVSLKAERLRF